MTRDDERRPEASAGDAGERGGERDARGAPDERERGRVPVPTPEETPELLGEQSDYPIAWEPSTDDGREG